MKIPAKINFNILGALRVFDGAKSISTIKNTIQTLKLPDFLIFFTYSDKKLLSKLFCYVGRQLLQQQV